MEHLLQVLYSWFNQSVNLRSGIYFFSTWTKKTRKRERERKNNSWYNYLTKRQPPPIKINYTTCLPFCQQRWWCYFKCQSNCQPLVFWEYHSQWIASHNRDIEEVLFLGQITKKQTGIRFFFTRSSKHLYQTFFPFFQGRAWLQVISQ